jgi:hypothetical protein
MNWSKKRPISRDSQFLMPQSTADRDRSPLGLAHWHNQSTNPICPVDRFHSRLSVNPLEISLKRLLDWAYQ